MELYLNEAYVRMHSNVCTFSGDGPRRASILSGTRRLLGALSYRYRGTIGDAGVVGAPCDEGP